MVMIFYSENASALPVVSKILGDPSKTDVVSAKDRSKSPAQQGLPMLKHREMCGPHGGGDKLAYSRPQGVLTESLSDPHNT